MFYIYADGKLLNQPLDESLIALSPKLTLEIGKAGSLEFSLPPSNTQYNLLRKLRTVITVELDETEIFRGRVLSHERNFNNIKKFYVEGNLAYLVDSVQKPEKYTGTTHALFRKIVAAHNAQMDVEKHFQVGQIGIEDRQIVITGQSDETEDPDTGAFDYKQIAINSISNDWSTTYDYIESCLIEYCGGYLRSRRVGDITYLDLVTAYDSDAVQEIEFGTNMLDLTEEATSEEVFTVLIPIGDDNLTIASVNGGSDELVDESALAEYGRIVKTHIFENVSQASTLLENAKRFMENHENVPITFTVRAVDLHLVDQKVEEIHVGDRVSIRSAPHGLSDRLTCTRIEYDLENPANNTYTFGNPKQTLTQRYREDKRKEASDVASSGGAGGGGAGSAAEEKTDEKLENFFKEWINVDPYNPDGHIDLGVAYEDLRNAKERLKQKTGIDLNAIDSIDGPNVNIYSIREAVDDIDGRVTENKAYITMRTNELKSQVDAQASWQEEFEGITREWTANLILEADKNGNAIAALKTSSEQRLADLELRSNEHEASFLAKAVYDATRASDLKLISNLSESIATLEARHGGRLATLEAKTTEYETSVVMKAEYEEKMATVEAKVTDLGTKITMNADEIELKADKTTINTRIAKINADIVDLSNTIEVKVNELTAKQIESFKGDVTWLSAKLLTVRSLTTENLNATNYISAPQIRMGGYTVATEAFVNDKVANFVSSSWIDNQGFSTKAYVDDRNAWGTVPSVGFRWCKVGGTNVQVALGNHTHSSYCTEARVRELIAAAQIPWGNISGKPSAYFPTSHRHAFSFSQTLGNGHTHTVTVGSTRYTTGGVSTNAQHSLSVSGNTGYAGG